jgi:hypothetical protein
LIAFSLSGFIFSFNYVLPLIFWGHVGLCLYYLEKPVDELNEIEDEEEDPDDHNHSYHHLLKDRNYKSPLKLVE